MRRILLLAALGSLPVFASCGSDDEAETSSSTSGGGAAGSGSGGSSGGPPEPGSTAGLGPAETMNEVMRRANEFDPTILWDVLPASYQKDVTRLVQEFGYEVDEEIYTGAIGVVSQLRDLLRDQFEFLMQHTMVAPVVAGLQMSPEEVQKSRDQIVEVLDTLLASELSSTRGLKDMDVGAFVRGPAAKVMATVTAAVEIDRLKEQVPGFEAVMGARATLVSQDGDRAVISLPNQDHPDETAQESFVLVEGKWIPAQLQLLWKDAIEEATMQVKETDFSEGKEETLAMMAAVTEVLAKLNAAETVSQFNIAALGVTEHFPLGGGEGGNPFDFLGGLGGVSEESDVPAGDGD